MPKYEYLSAKMDFLSRINQVSSDYGQKILDQINNLSNESLYYGLRYSKNEINPFGYYLFVYALRQVKENRVIPIDTLNYYQTIFETAIIENKKVIGPKKDVIEVLNAIKGYDSLITFNPVSSKSFLSAHKLLMKELIEKPGKYRSQGVGIFQGAKVAHIAPPAQNVPYLMADLFKYLKNKDELTLIKGCVFHYEMEFIHPFMDGNGRMGRLWQTVILM